MFSAAQPATYHQGVAEGRYEVIPLRTGSPVGGRYINVSPSDVGYKSVPSAFICGAPVEQGQQSAVGDGLPSHPQPVVAVPLPAQGGGEVVGEHEE